MCQRSTTPNRHMTHDKIPTCSSVQSGQIHLDFRHQTRLLCNLARPNNSRSQQTFPANIRNSKRSHGPNTTEYLIHEMENTRKRQRTSYGSYPGPPQLHHQPSLCDCTGRVYTDQTGQFLVRSSNGYRYMLVLYHYDTNAILVEPLKTRHGNEILRGYTKLYTHLTERGFKPTTHWLDNEASNALKAFNRTQDIEYQLVPPHVHRRNSAERAIRTWKNYFVAGICSTDTAFPLHLWDRVIKQATITLSLLRPA
jgi:hypothetical protein